jgi:diketogulonate reductase-like aldo/keto reductase
MINVLYHIALKHRVTIETVVLRWTLQLESVSSIVVPWNTQEEMIEDQPLRLRQVFSLELDEEDVYKLWEASGCEIPSMELPELDFDNLEQGDNGIFLPSDAGLWGI